MIIFTHKSSLYEDPSYFKSIESIPEYISLFHHETPNSTETDVVKERAVGSARSLFRLAALRPDTLKKIAKGLAKEEDLRTAYNSTMSLDLRANIPISFPKGPVINYNSFMHKITAKYYNKIVTAIDMDVLTEVIGRESLYSNNLRIITKGMNLNPSIGTPFKQVGFEIENYLTAGF